MNTGHDSYLTTLHATSPRDALSRLETMGMFSGIDLPEKNIKSQIASAINIIIQVSRLSDGSRKITKVSEIVGMEGDVITMQDIFVWEQTGAGVNTVMGMHSSTGIRPKFLDKITANGIEINPQIFDRGYRHTYLSKNGNKSQMPTTPAAVETNKAREEIANKEMVLNVDLLKRLKR